MESSQGNKKRFSLRDEKNGDELANVPEVFVKRFSSPGYQQPAQEDPLPPRPQAVSKIAFFNKNFTEKLSSEFIIAPVGGKCLVSCKVLRIYDIQH